jgi:hypothetical protein
LVTKAWRNHWEGDSFFPTTSASTMRFSPLEWSEWAESWIVRCALCAIDRGSAESGCVSVHGKLGIDNLRKLRSRASFELITAANLVEPFGFVSATRTCLARATVYMV